MSEKSWTEICLKVPSDKTEIACDIASVLCDGGLYLEDYRDLEQGAREIAHSDLIDRSLLEKDRAHSLLHLYFSPEEHPSEAIAFLSERMRGENIPFEQSIRQVEEEDWANTWKRYFKPTPVGSRLLICPTWEQTQPQDGRIVLPIDPGMAFGTGTHETTRMVLEALEEAVSPGCAMLDVGCGSGILSLAALLLGAGSALAVDIDPLSVKTARENGARLGFAPPAFTVVQGDLAREVGGSFDVVAANIVADAILALSPAVPRLLKKGGKYLVSGIIDTREREVRERLGSLGFRLSRRKENRGWICLELTL